MSEQRDEFRDYLVSQITATEQAMRENDDFMLATVLGVRRDILRAYDATAADRERERRALVVFDDAARIWTQGSAFCPEDCTLKAMCNTYRVSCEALTVLGRKRGILPAEEATNG